MPSSGPGVIGQLRAQAISHNPATALLGVADADLASAQAGRRAPSEPEAFQDYRPLLDDPQVEVVFISTPVQLHEEMVLAALAAGKHVFCEKPLANSVDACRRMLQAAKSHGRTLAVGFNHRYYPVGQVSQAGDR